MAEGDAWRSAVGDPRLARHVPSPATSGSLPGSEGQAGVPGRVGGSDGAPGGAERVVGYRPLEPGEQARHTEALAGALRETWMAGEQLNMERPVGERIDWLQFAHAVENRLIEAEGEPGPAAPFAPVRAPVDTRLAHLVGVWLRRTQNDSPRLAEELMNDVAAVVRGAR